MDKRPIGVFDSGLGGLTVVKEIRRQLPNEDIVYFGDTGRVPYGNRSKETIRKYAAQDIAFLRQFDIKMIVAACGTVSSIMTKADADKLGIPFIGVVAPTAQCAAATSATGRIGVIGTAATIKSMSYGKIIKSIRHDAVVIGKACPLFVPLVEYGFANKGDGVAKTVAQEYLEVFQKEQVDTLILGCTHYPLLYDVINDVLGYAVTLVDAGTETVRYLESYLSKDGMLNSQETPGSCQYYVSDSPEGFCEIAELFLKEPIKGSIKQIDINEIGV